MSKVIKPMPITSSCRKACSLLPRCSARFGYSCANQVLHDWNIQQEQNKTFQHHTLRYGVVDTFDNLRAADLDAEIE